MKSKIIISNREILFLTMAQLSGAAAIYLPGVNEAGRDVWISNLIACVMAYIVTYTHYLPLGLCPGCSMTVTLKKYWGKFLGGLVNFYYLIFFYILSMLIVSDVYYFGKIIMPETPPFVFLIFFIIPAIYGIKLGLEVISRLIEFSIPILVIVFFILFILVMPQIDYEKLLPIMADGVKPVLYGAIPNMNFPYAQILPIAFLYTYVTNDPAKGNRFIRYTFLGIFVATVLLTVRALASAAAFDQYTLQTLKFPPFNTIRIIEVGETIERLDIIFMAIFYITTFFKFAITFYVICQIISDLFSAGEPKDFAIPIAVLIGVSMPLFIPRFDIIMQTVLPYFFISLPLFFPIPLLLYITIKLKNGNRDKQGSPR